MRAVTIPIVLFFARTTIVHASWRNERRERAPFEAIKNSAPDIVIAQTSIFAEEDYGTYNSLFNEMQGISIDYTYQTFCTIVNACRQHLPSDPLASTDTIIEIERYSYRDEKWMRMKDVIIWQLDRDESRRLVLHRVHPTLFRWLYSKGTSIELKGCAASPEIAVFLLEAEREKHEVELQQKQNQIVMAVCIGGGILLVTGIVVFIWWRRTKKKTSDDMD